jgi:endonuclease YncB( thermonuclease family)
MVFLSTPTVEAQIQHPLAARRIHVHRVNVHRENVAGAIEQRRENIAEVREERAENIAARRTAVAARVILPRYAAATVAATGAILSPPAPALQTAPPAPMPPGSALTDEEYKGLHSDELPNLFEGSTSYPVLRVEDDGATVVVQAGTGATRVRLIGVAAVTLGERVDLAERHPGIRLPSTQTFVENLLKGESVYVVYDTQVAAADADGKSVAYLFRAPDGLLINLEVIRAGFAVTEAGYEFDQKALFQRYQNAARTAENGIYGMIARIKAARGTE